MLTVTLPDGSKKEYEKSVTPLDVAADISEGLARAVVAAQVDGKTVGLDFHLGDNAEVELNLLKKENPEALDVMRHSCAHIMARAIMRLYDGVQLAFGPTIDGGFYYDFDLPHSISEEDFPKIEAEMKKIIKENEPFERIEEPREKALDICKEIDQQFKVEHISEGLADHDSVSFYRQGEFIDLCRGPHVPKPGVIGAYKLLSVAGAYWKGDSKNKQLQRVYATAFFSNKELKKHLERIEEAKKRDHRVLGKKHNLFTIDPMVGSGMILWQPKGARVRSLLESFVKDELERRGYEPVYTPNIGSIDLYKTSGHFPYYEESQFPPLFEHPLGHVVHAMLRLRAADAYSDDQLIQMFDEFQSEDVPPRLRATLPGYAKLSDAAAKVAAIQKWLDDQEVYLLKPMNCPHHVKIYQANPRSYRELPLRLAEFGTVYRYEQSGELSGMSRVRAFTQDDAHIFCTNDQVAEEFKGCIEMTQFVLDCLGMENYRVRLGYREPDSNKYVGDAALWDWAQSELASVCQELGIDAQAEQGEAAFYGPKADFVVTDCIGREWQLGTVQLDYNLPSTERFALEYVGADNAAHRPVMIHRAPLGSMERFISVLIEHFAGAFPLWLAPEQVRVLTVSEKSEEYGRQVHQALRDAGLRVTGDYRAEKLGAKIRDAQLELIPYMFVVGPRDAEGKTVSVRDRIEGDVGALQIDAAIEKLKTEVAEKTVRKTYGGDAGLVDRGSKMEY